MMPRYHCLPCCCRQHARASATATAITIVRGSKGQVMMLSHHHPPCRRHHCTMWFAPPPKLPSRGQAKERWWCRGIIACPVAVVNVHKHPPLPLPLPSCGQVRDRFNMHERPHHCCHHHCTNKWGTGAQTSLSALLPLSTCRVVIAPHLHHPPTASPPQAMVDCWICHLYSCPHPPISTNISLLIRVVFRPISFKTLLLLNKHHPYGPYCNLKIQLLCPILVSSNQIRSRCKDHGDSEIPQKIDMTPELKKSNDQLKI